MTSVATHSPFSSITRHAACSIPLRRYMCQGFEPDRSRGVPPQSRDRVNRSRGFRASAGAELSSSDPRLLITH